MEQCKRILLVSHEMTYTGAPRSLLGMAEILRGEGFIVEVWTLQPGVFMKEFEKAGIEVKTVSFPESASENMTCRIRDYDLVIANTIFCAAFAGYAGRYTATVLYIREAQNIPGLIADCGLNETDIKRAEHIVCVSGYAEAFLRNQYRLQDVTVIPNFVEDVYGENNTGNKNASIYSKTGRRPFNRRAPLPDKRTNEVTDFLVAGTIEPRKGQEMAVEAFFLLPEAEKSRARLHLVGAMPEWASGYQKKLCLECDDRIIYHGEIRERKRLLKLYESMDVILVPSLDESCSLVVLEAAMLGKAILLTENVGAKYLVEPECIVKTNDSAALSAKMLECIQNPEMLKKLGDRNRSRYLEWGTREKYQQNIKAYLTRILQPGENTQEGERNTKPGNTMQPKVSIVVPVYNVEKYLRTCMDSLVSQTLMDIEIICVDDGSTDGSPGIIEEYRRQDGRVYIITTQNYGYGHAMNTGIAAASGEYIGIVEPDDYVDRKMYETLYHRAIAVDAEIVKGDFYRFYGEGDGRTNVYHATARVPENYDRVICPKNEKDCFRFIMNTWSGIYRRSFLEEYQICHNETPGASYQDNGFWFQGFCQAKRIYFVPEALYYNRRDNPDSSVNDRKKVYCANEEYAYIRAFLVEHPKLESEYLFWYSMKKYHTYIFTLRRIGWEYKREYLEKISKEFREAEQKGEFSKAVFTPQEWADIHWMMRDSGEYYEKMVKGEVQISVVIPVYNAAEYLEQCLRSVEKQYFQKIEVICIDDGSTDASPQILKSFAERDKRFRICRQKNAGAGAARNLGLCMAMGEYVIFLDADDYFAPEMLLHAWQKIRETESDICVMGSWQQDNESGEIIPCMYSLQTEHYPGYRPFRVSDMQYNPFRCFVGWAWDKLYRRSFLLNHDLQFQEQRTSNDMYFTYMSLFKADKITTLDERVIYQRRNIQNSLSMTRERSWECFYYALLAMRKELDAMGLFQRNRVYFENYALHSCLWNLETLPEEAACKLFHKLEREWFKVLGIYELKEQEFEYPGEWESLMLLTQQKVQGLKTFRDSYWKRQEVQRKIGRKETKVVQRSEIKNTVHAKNSKDFGSEAEYYLYCLDEIRKSKSYKIGMAVTWLPRKIRGW